MPVSSSSQRGCAFRPETISPFQRFSQVEEQQNEEEVGLGGDHQADPEQQHADKGGCLSLATAIPPLQHGHHKALWKWLIIALICITLNAPENIFRLVTLFSLKNYTEDAAQFCSRMIAQALYFSQFAFNAIYLAVFGRCRLDLKDFFLFQSTTKALDQKRTRCTPQQVRPPPCRGHSHGRCPREYHHCRSERVTGKMSVFPAVAIRLLHVSEAPIQVKLRFPNPCLHVAPNRSNLRSPDRRLPV